MENQKPAALPATPAAVAPTDTLTADSLRLAADDLLTGRSRTTDQKVKDCLWQSATFLVKAAKLLDAAARRAAKEVKP
jgi:hypothetical protein